MKEERSTSLRFGNKSGKVIPREISEGLGKLPPSALDLEDTVLGGLMLEAGAYDLVKDFLRPDHFYSPTHQEIFQAIVDLRNEHAPADMRTVVNQLRKTGKLELVGGSYVIAELTSKVSSAANVEYHARVILECAMKREVIVYGSRLQSLAYEDTTDVFDLIDKMQNDAKAIKDTNITEPSAAKIQAQWKDRLLEIEPEKETPILFIDGVPIGTPGNHSVVNGKKKSRKTLFLVWLITEYLKLPNTHPDDVAFFDTEQGKSHVYAIRDKVFQITSKKIPVFYLRGMSPVERQEFIEHTVTHWGSKFKTPKPKLAFIDGIRDLVSNINDIDECTELIVWLEKLILNHNLHVCDVIHQNKSELDKNARGHLGTELGNKAQTVIELEVDKKAGVTMVKCQDSRDKPFETFAFTHGRNDLPEVVGMPTKEGESMPESEEHKLIRLVFEDGALLRPQLEQNVKECFRVGVGKAKQFIRSWMGEGWVIKNGKDYAKGTTYQLITDTFAKLTPLSELHPPENTQGNIFDTPPDFPDMPF